MTSVSLEIRVMIIHIPVESCFEIRFGETAVKPKPHLPNDFQGKQSVGVL